MHTKQNAISPAPSAAANGYSCYARLPLRAFDLLERTPSEIAMLAVSCGIDARQGV